jgi:hypothetical protein
MPPKKETPMTTTPETQSWPDLAIGLYDKLTGRGAEITYEFSEFKVVVPGGTAANAPSAPWTLNGTLRIRTRDQQAK